MRQLLEEQQKIEQDPPAPIPARGWRHAPTFFAAAFLTLATLLLLRNRALFSVVVNEGGDSGANSILVLRAKGFDQLVGNYSRIGFNHPGPAFLYVQAFGEWLLHDWLHAVPSPWNGQAVALLVLNAALLAGMLAVLGSWLRSWAATGSAGAVLLAYAATAPDPVIAGTWMPLLYFPPFLLLLTAAASVAAGRADHLWVLGLAGGLLMHGHAEFLFFVPVITGTAVTLLIHRRRREPADSALSRTYRRAWLLLAGVLAVFALPILVNLIAHWPGEFGKYFEYGSSAEAGAHSPWGAAEYVVRFWPGEHPVVRPIVAVASWTAAVALTRRLPDGPIRRYSRTALGIAGLATALFASYAQFGIDHLSESYIGFFSYALTLLIVTVVALATLELLRNHAPSVVPAGTAIALVVGLLAATNAATLETPRYDDVPALPTAMAALTIRAHGRPVVVELRGERPPPDPTALLLAGQRSAIRICIRDPRWTWIVTEALVCTVDEVATGQRTLLSAADAVPPGSTAIADLGSTVLSVPAEPAPAG